LIITILSLLGKGFKMGVFRQVCHWAIELLVKNINGGENSANQLIGQMCNYSNYEKPYEFKYSKSFTVESWWLMVEQRDNWIQKLALMIFAITPHNAGCERVFSVLGWMCSKRRSR
jgi:hypothetical protein